jgi:two-component system sensor histidine kinase UhpB
LDNLGVWPAIEWQTGEIAQRAGIRCSVEIEASLQDLDLPPACATSLFRIVQESLSNVWRHAHASKVSVHACRRPGELIVEVHDDGRGLPAGESEKPGHWGIIGMRERAASHGGSLEVVSASGTGTTVRIRLPLDRP